MIKHITAILPNLTGCDGSHGSGCCTSSTPCGENEGDCDGDSDCFGNLKCGDDNCNNSTFSWWEDCCYDPAKGEFPFPDFQLILSILLLVVHVGMVSIRAKPYTLHRMNF